MEQRPSYLAQWLECNKNLRIAKESKGDFRFSFNLFYFFVKIWPGWSWL